MHPSELSIFDFTYDLPPERIALHPLPERDSSRLLVYEKGNIQDVIFINVAQHLPENSLLIFNDTRVIKARIRFQKPTGGFIEIFCLEPFGEMKGYESVMNTKETVRWKCMIGGAGKWKEGLLDKKLAVGDLQAYNKQWAMGNQEWTISAKLIEKLEDTYVAEFSWKPAGLSFAEVLELAGDIPLPPYIKRKTEEQDIQRYQTVYAREQGSVAAPTAGLHFTDAVFVSLQKKKIRSEFVTLHVGAGTFKPVKASVMRNHEMHEEWISVNITTIERLRENIPGNCIAVGTTSARTLESLYWMGVKAMIDPGLKQLDLGQWEVYEEKLNELNISPDQAMAALADWLRQHDQEKFFTTTRLMIAPGYRFRMISHLITNFHQPQSTLLLLVAAAIGNDWIKCYRHALQNGYRFLSYGDSCLLYINS